MFQTPNQNLGRRAPCQALSAQGMVFLGFTFLFCQEETQRRLLWFQQALVQLGLVANTAIFHLMLSFQECRGKQLSHTGFHPHFKGSLEGQLVTVHCCPGKLPQMGNCGAVEPKLKLTDHAKEELTCSAHPVKLQEACKSLRVSNQVDSNKQS